MLIDNERLYHDCSLGKIVRKKTIFSRLAIKGDNREYKAGVIERKKCVQILLSYKRLIFLFCRNGWISVFGFQESE